MIRWLIASFFVFSSMRLHTIELKKLFHESNQKDGISILQEAQESIDLLWIAIDSGGSGSRGNCVVGCDGRWFKINSTTEESSTLFVGGDSTTNVDVNGVGSWSSSISPLFHLKILKFGSVNLDVHAGALS